MTKIEKLEQINNFLDCIARYTSDNSNGILMSLEVFNTNISTNLTVFKEYQKKRWYKRGRCISTGKNMIYFENILNKLTLTKIDEKDIFYSKFPIQKSSPYFLPYDLTYFSEWFLKKSYNKNYVTGEILSARDAILEQLNELFSLYYLDFQFFKDANKIHPSFYTIRDEDPGLIEGYYCMQRGFHLFICFENITFMFEFTSCD